MSESPIFLIILALLLIYLLWMDLALYFKLQSGYDAFLVVQNYKSQNLLNGTIPHSSSSSSSSSTSLSHSPGSPHLPYYDPFNPLSVKLLMLDHLNHYLFYPLCWWLDTYFLHISDRLVFITPDMISLSHVAIAAMGAKLIMSESLSQRRFGVLLFHVRTMLDSYDGMVARARANTRGLSQVAGSWGYWMDGICDAAGTLLFMGGAWVLLRRRIHRRWGAGNAESGPGAAENGNGLSVFELAALAGKTDEEPLLESQNNHHSSKKSSSSSLTSLSSWTWRNSVLTASSMTILLLILQEFFGSFFWNRYMEHYHDLLEVPMVKQGPKPISLEAFQVSTLQSSTFWIISWLWKLLNPHSHMSLLLTFVFFDRTVAGFTLIRYLGFIPLAALVLCSETHFQTVAWQWSYLTNADN